MAETGGESTADDLHDEAVQDELADGVDDEFDEFADLPNIMDAVKALAAGATPEEVAQGWAEASNRTPWPYSDELTASLARVFQ